MASSASSGPSSGASRSGDGSQPPIDWIESIIILVPLIGFVGWIAVTRLRERRRETRGEGRAEA